MIHKNKTKFLMVILVLLILYAGDFCSAAFLQPKTKDEVDVQAGQVGAFGGYAVVEGKEGVLNLIQTVINAFLSIIGVLLLAYTLYSGYNWLTARGEEEKVEKAKDSLRRAIIGAIIIVAAYAISTFVMYRLQQGTLKNSSTNTLQAPYV